MLVARPNPLAPATACPALLKAYSEKMVSTPLVRVWWRLRGAWLWPAFVGLTLLDGAIVRWLPLSGDTESPVAGWLIGLFASLVGIVVVAPPVARGLRRLRPDLPKVVARNSAGAVVVVGVTAVLLLAGALHRQSVSSDQHALQDAIARAQAFIGDRAPPRFRDSLPAVDTLPIQPPQIYRVCVHGSPSAADARTDKETYCVVVNRGKRFGRGVKFSGYEPNALLGQGT